MKELSNQIHKNNIAIGRQASFFWLVSPFVLLLLTNTFVIFSGQQYSPVELYFGSQINWFKSLNFELNKLLTAFWSNKTQLGEAVVLLPIVFVLTLSKRNAWLAAIYSIPVTSLLSVVLKRLSSVLWAVKLIFIKVIRCQ